MANQEKSFPDRNREKKINLNGLYAVSSTYALDEKGNPLNGVYGVVSKNTPYICKAKPAGSSKADLFKKDMTGNEVPNVLKNRILAFYSDKNNSKKSTCYLVEKPLYEEMVGHKVGRSVKKSTGQSSFSGQNSVRKPATTNYGRSTKNKVDF